MHLNFPSVQFLTILRLHVCLVSAAFNCSPAAIETPQLFGAKIINILAAEVHNYSGYAPVVNGNPSGPSTPLDFCNVTVAYTHPGQNDIINVYVWLPLQGWNGRFQGTGGGGYTTGLGSLVLFNAISYGYAAASTDGGHALGPSPDASIDSWALISPGNVNLYLFQDFAHVALNDMTVIGKAVTTSFYGCSPSRSYWYGCSTGGRQGLMMAQKYPKAYDGIVAGSPAINWASFAVAEAWPMLVMNKLKTYPSQCEIAAFTQEAIKSCDGLDGLVDGIIGAPELCDFDPRSVVGKAYQCSTGGNGSVLTAEGAEVVSAAWNGPRSPSRKLGWYGLNKDASLDSVTQLAEGQPPVVPPSLADTWIRYFVIKDPTFSTANMTDEDFFDLLHASRNEYDSIISANDPDLSEFKRNGGKMIASHGQADPLIPIQGTEDYYKRVLRQDPNAQDFFRYFEAPGVAHCEGGVGAYPRDTLQKLVRWVEEGVAPETLTASYYSTARDLCPYPLVQRYVGGNSNVPESFRCVDREES